MALGLNVSVEEKDKHKIVRLEGRLDATTTPALEGKISKVLEQNKVHMLMDFSKVDYLSSAGMRLLLSAAKKVKAHGGKLVFCAMNDEVMEIIKMAGFERILAIYPSEEAALKACG
ncbi:MAG: STAS domain-containing protein [Chlamydiales bacterium]|nr:STAS domain-containing protein [Chlamydiales bacterium]